MALSIIRRIYRKFSKPVRPQVSSIKGVYTDLAIKMKLQPIRVEACLLGGDNGISSARFARMVGDIRRASRPVSEWPHVKLLRESDAIGDRLWEPGVFEQTEYYKNAVLNIEMFGSYHGALTPDQIQWGPRRFVDAYRGAKETLTRQKGETYERDSEAVAVRPVKDSSCYQVLEGHHRLALAYARGIREVQAVIKQPPVATPVQELLLDVLWLRGRREIYQPIDVPEVADWVLVRRCTDRFAKIAAFLREENMMPPVRGSYLDVACSYGWFVAEMAKIGFDAEGVERDPIAITVGREMYGLRQGQVHRADSVTFLRALQTKYDVTSCFSLVHHFFMNNFNVSPEELMHLLDAATGHVMFFDMGQGHEYPESRLAGWGAEQVQSWLEANTTFKRIVPLGPDEDAVPPNEKSFGRMLFACVR
jgi:SAM-dependent methyltransferase